MRILIDLDSTIADTLPHWIERINKIGGIAATVDDVVKWDIADCHPISQVDKKFIFRILQDRKWLLSMPPIPGAIEAVERLNKQHEIFVVTARHGSVSIPASQEWIKTHLPFLDHKLQVVYLYHKHILVGDVLIDDKGDNLKLFTDTHSKSIAMGLAYKHNLAYASDRISLHNSWADIENAVKAFEERSVKSNS